MPRKPKTPPPKKRPERGLKGFIRQCIKDGGDFTFEQLMQMAAMVAVETEDDGHFTGSRQNVRLKAIDTMVKIKQAKDPKPAAADKDDSSDDDTDSEGFLQWRDRQTTSKP